MAKSKRVLLLAHPQFRPDRFPKRVGTERDVWLALRRLGHSVRVCGLSHDLTDLDHELAEFRPQVVFNLLEEFRTEAVFDFHAVSYLEARGVPYTGCNPRGLILSRNKFLMTQIASGLGVRVPESFLFGRGLPRLKAPAEFPLFVKLNREHASLGIRESNLVRNKAQLRGTCNRLRRDFASEILVQKFISGDDVSVGVWGNRKCEALAPRKLRLQGTARVSTARVKFSPAHQRRHAIKAVEFFGHCGPQIQAEAARLFRQLDLSGYARFDYRVNAAMEPYLIDVNANPNLARGEDFATALLARGWTYIEVIENILALARSYRPNV